MNHGYTYQDTLAASAKVDWEVEDLIGGEKTLDDSLAADIGLLVKPLVGREV